MCEREMKKCVNLVLVECAERVTDCIVITLSVAKSGAFKGPCTNDIC